MRKLSALKLAIVILAFLAVGAFGIEAAYAVPSDVKAKSEFILANKLFTEKNYSGAIDHVKNVKKILGKANSRTESLLAKAYHEKKEYANALASIESFFKVTPESFANDQLYIEMVELYSMVIQDIEKEKMDVQNRLELSKQQKINEQLDKEIRECKLECRRVNTILYEIEKQRCVLQAHDNYGAADYAVTAVGGLLTLGLSDSTSETITKRAKQCLRELSKRSSGFNDDNCQNKSYREAKLKERHENNSESFDSLIVLGDSPTVGYNYDTVYNYLRITEVVSSSPADRAGLKYQDSIISIDGEPLNDFKKVNIIRDEIVAGKRSNAILGILRNGSLIKYKLSKY